MIRTAAVTDMGTDFIASLHVDGDDVLVLFNGLLSDEVRVPVVNELLRDYEQRACRAPLRLVQVASSVAVLGVLAQVGPLVELVTAPAAQVVAS